MESRVLLTVTTNFTPGTGQLDVSSDAADAITIGIDGGSGNVTVNASDTGVSPASVQILNVTGGPGTNAIDLSAVTAASFPNLVDVDVDAAGGDDSVIGSELDDFILGGSGDDTIEGGLGNDDILGSSGRDSLDGGDGDDRLRGQGSSGDVLTGGTGNDTLEGGSGTDKAQESGDVDFVATDAALTGMGNDGAIAAPRLAAQGAAIWAQSADSCAVSSQPDSVRETGCVGYSGTPEQLARQLVDRVRREVAETARVSGEPRIS